MDVLAFPDVEEIKEILNSSAAKNSFIDRKAMLYSTTYGGMRFRIALVQDGIDTEVHTARFIAASCASDLRSCFSPIYKRS